MLSVTGPYTRLGTVLSALIVVGGVIGLTMHKDFYARKRRKDFFCFYTNVSNLFVLLYFALAAPQLYKNPALHPLIPHTEFAVMMCILLTFSVFHLLLYPAIRQAARSALRTREYWIVYTDNFIIHYLVPLGVLIYWLLCSPGKQALGAVDALYWTALPLAYIMLIFLRARSKGIIEEVGSPYPYPFLDVGVLGAGFVLHTCSLLYGICVLSGLIMIALARIFLV